MSLLSFFRSGKRMLRSSGLNQNLVLFGTSRSGFPAEKRTMGFESPKHNLIAINKNLVYAAPAKARVVLKHEIAHTIRDRYPYKDPKDTHDELFQGISFLMGGSVNENEAYMMRPKYYNFVCSTCGFRTERMLNSNSPPYCPECQQKYGIKKRLLVHTIKHPAISDDL